MTSLAHSFCGLDQAEKKVGAGVRAMREEGYVARSVDNDVEEQEVYEAFCSNEREGTKGGGVR